MSAQQLRCGPVLALFLLLSYSSLVGASTCADVNGVGFFLRLDPTGLNPTTCWNNNKYCGPDNYGTCDRDGWWDKSLLGNSAMIDCPGRHMDKSDAKACIAKPGTMLELDGAPWWWWTSSDVCTSNDPPRNNLKYLQKGQDWYGGWKILRGREVGESQPPQPQSQDYRINCPGLDKLFNTIPQLKELDWQLPVQLF